MMTSQAVALWGLSVREHFFSVKKWRNKRNYSAVCSAGLGVRAFLLSIILSIFSAASVQASEALEFNLHKHGLEYFGDSLIVKHEVFEITEGNITLTVRASTEPHEHTSHPAPDTVWVHQDSSGLGVLYDSNGIPVVDELGLDSYAQFTDTLTFEFTDATTGEAKNVRISELRFKLFEPLAGADDAFIVSLDGEDILHVTDDLIGDSLSYKAVAWFEDIHLTATWLLQSAFIVDGFALKPGHESTFKLYSIKLEPYNNQPDIEPIPTLNATETLPFAYQVEASDADGDALSYHWVGATPSGLQLDALSGLITWTPAVGQAGEHTVDLKVIDDEGAESEPQTVVIQVAPKPNQAPQIQLPHVTAAQETLAYNYPVQATDADGDSLTFALTDAPQGMNIDEDSGLITWLPLVGSAGHVSVSLVVSDGQGGSDADTFTITVLERPNQAPQISSDPVLQATELATYQYAVTATDADGDPLSFQVSSDADGLSIDGSGLVQWTPPLGTVSNGSSLTVTVTVTVQDNHGGQDSQTYDLTVQQHAAPVISSSASHHSTELLAYQFPVFATGAPGTQLTYALTGASSSGMTINANSGLFTWTPVLGSVGPQSVTIVVDDGFGGTTLQPISFDVALHDAPDITSTPNPNATELIAYQYAVVATGSPGTQLTYALTDASSSGMTIDANSGLFTWTPPLGSVGPQSVTLIVDDGYGATTQQTVTLDVALHAAPQFIGAPLTEGQVGELYHHQAQVIAAAGTQLTFSLNKAPQGLQMDSASGAITWTPSSNQRGSHQVQLHVDDGYGASANTNYLIQVAAAANQAPSITSDAITHAQQQLAYQYDVDANDPDHDAIQFSLSSAPAGMTIASNTGLIRWTPDAHSPTSVSVTVDVSDSHGASDQQAFTIHVSAAPNQPPVFTSKPITEAMADTSYVYSAVAIDPEDDAISYTLQAGHPETMAIGLVSGQLSWAPTTADAGPHSVVIIASDGHGNESRQYFIVTVSTALNGAPVITSTPTTRADEGQLYQYQVQADDPDGDVLSYSLSQAPDGMTISEMVGTVQWTPGFDSVGSQSIRVQVQDIHGAFTEQAYVIDVTGRSNLAPQITSSAPTSIHVGGLYSYTITAHDPDGDPLTFQLESGPVGMTLHSDTGVLSWVATEASDQWIDISVHDGRGGSDSQSFTLMVSLEFENDAPVFITEPVIYVTEGEDFYYRAEAVDPDGDPIVYQSDFVSDKAIFNNLSAELQWPVDSQYNYGLKQFNSQCRKPPLIKRSTLDIVQKFHWQGGSTGIEEVQGPVIVAQLSDDNLDGEINEDDIPDLIFAVGNHPWDVDYTTLIALSGGDGSELWTVDGSIQSSRGSVAAGDIDGDGIVEIIASSLDRSLLTALEEDGTIKWQVATGLPEFKGHGDGISIVDLDLDGTPEIVQSNSVFDNTGQRLWLGKHDRGASLYRNNWGWQSVPANVDLEGGVEIIAGRTLYSSTGEVIWHQTAIGSDGFNAVGNFDSDDEAEIVVVSNGNVFLLEHTGDIIWGPVSEPGSGKYGGTPAVADLDGDGEAEIAVSFITKLVIFETDGTVKWSYDITDGSGSTGASVFDFEGDGRSEVLYYDHNTFRVFDGRNGDLLTEIINGNTTVMDYPVVADIDNDGSAEILITSSWQLGTEGVRAFSSSSKTWMPTRPIWNQHAYSITNVNTDGTIPVEAEPSWLTHNGFHLNLLEEALGLSDLTLLEASYDDEGEQLIITLVNRGLKSVTEPFSVEVSSANQTLYSTSIPSLSSNNTTTINIDGISYYDLTDDIEVNITPSHDTEECETRNNLVQVPLFKLIAEDIHNAQGYHAFIVNVQELNLPPVLVETSPELNAVSDVLFEYRIVAEDPNIGDGLFYEMIDGPDGSEVQAVGGLFRWNPAEDQVGTHSFTVGISDLSGEYIESEFTINVEENTNQPPYIISESGIWAYPNEEYQNIIYAEDDRDALLTYELIAWTSPNIAQSGNVITWTPTESELGEASYAVRITDTEGAFVIHNVLLGVLEPGNTAPAITNHPALSAYPSQLYEHQIQAEDIDEDPLQYTALIFPEKNVSFYGKGLLQWVPTENDIGTYNVTFEVRDGRYGLTRQSFQLTVYPKDDPNAPNTPPQITSEPGFLALTNEVYSYQITTVDSDNDGLSYQLTEKPDTMSISDLGLITWLPTDSEIGNHLVEILVTDARGASTTQSYWLSASDQVLGDLPPIINSSPELTVESGQFYGYQLEASDPEQGGLTFYLSQGPPEMTLDAESGWLSWQTELATSGLFAVEIQVMDEVGNSTSQLYNLQVNPSHNPGLPPEITSAPPTTAVANQLYQYALSATDPDDDSLQYAIVTAPDATMQVDANGLVTWTPSSDQVGSHTIVLRVFEDTYYVDQEYTLTVDAHALPLDLLVSADPQQVEVDETTTLTVEVIGGRGEVSVTATMDGQPLTLDSANQVQVSASTIGRHSIDVSAVDSDGAPVTYHTYFSVMDPTDAMPPEVWITSPGELADITEPVSIIGTVNDDNLVNYVVAVQMKQDDQYQIIAEGSEPVIDAELARLDPSLMMNGMVDVIVQAEDANGQISYNSVSLTLSGDLKVGNFSFTVVDMEVPMLGLPVRVTRTYDSRQKYRDLDFGYGWSVGYQDVRVEESSEPTEGWYQEQENLQFQVDDQIVTLRGTCTFAYSDKRVTVTLPNGDIERFRVRPDIVSGGAVSLNNPNCVMLAGRNYRLHFDAEAGTLSTLTSSDAIELYLTDVGGGHLSSGIDDSQAKAITDYTLTTRTGYIYQLDQDFGIVSVTDPNGNRLTYNDSGIHHSAGKSLLFERDEHHRIQAIIDPAGNRREYVYNSVGDLAQATDAAQQSVSYTYNNQHGLIDILDPLNRPLIRNIYNDDGRLIAQEDNDGHRTAFDHDIDGRQSVVTDRRNNPTIYYYDDRGNVLAMIDALNQRTDYRYDDDDNQLSVSNALGETESATYDAADNQLTRTNHLGHTVRYSYNQRGQELTLQDANGHTYVNDYDGAGNLLSITDPLLNEARNQVLPNGLIEHTTDVTGATTHYTYTETGQVRTETNALNEVTTYDYDDNNNRSHEHRPRTLADGSVVTETTQYEYDELNRLVKTTYADLTSSEVEYNRVGHKVAEIDEFDRRTEYDYDVYGRVLEIRYPDSTFEQRRYDDEGNLLSETDRAGHTTSYAYDALNRRWQTTFHDQTTSETEYDAAGRISADIDARNQRTRYQYDGAGRRTEVINPLDQRHSFAYDAADNLVRETDANGHRTHYEYNELDQREITRYHDGSEMRETFDAMGRRLSQTDPANRTTQYRYDDLGRLTRVIDSRLQETAYGYDEAGNQRSQTDAKLRTTAWTYDSRGRTLSRTLPLGMSESDAYDERGNRTQHIDFNGETLTFVYDLNNDRLLEIHDSDGLRDHYTYSAHGLTKTAGNRSGTTSYDYDNRDRLVREEQPSGAVLTYQYDNAGNRTQVKVSHNGVDTVTDYSYDDANRLATVTDVQGSTSYAYDAVGNLASITYANGVVTSYEYDALNRLVHMQSVNGDGDLLSQYDYTLHITGRREQVREVTGRTVNYQYDDLYRLTHETVDDPLTGTYVAEYQYDEVGNRVYSIVDGVQTAYDYDLNDRLTQQGGTHYEYDDNGNTLREWIDELETLYHYDSGNRLVQVDKVDSGSGDSSSSEYAYNASGIRIGVSEAGVATDFVVDSNRDYAQVLREVNATEVVDYTYGHDLVSQVRNETAHYYLYDGLGSARGLSDLSGVLSDVYDYDAFGEVLYEAGGTENRYRFAGEQFDSSLGQYYLRARYYDQGVGRFSQMDVWDGISNDPVSLHKYLYANADPANGIDPSGYYTLRQIGLGIQVAGTLASIGTASYEAYSGLQEGKSLGEVGAKLAADAAIGVGASLVSGGILRYSPYFLRIRPSWLKGPVTGRPKSSLWNSKSITVRGEAVEDVILGGQRGLPWNYPTIDDFTSGIATSIKSMDLLADSSTASRIKSNIKRDANKLKNFVPRNWGTAKLAGQPVTARILVYAFERGTATKDQAKALKEVAEELSSSNSNVKVVFKWLE